MVSVVGKSVGDLSRKLAYPGLARRYLLLSHYVIPANQKNLPLFDAAIHSYMRSVKRKNLLTVRGRVVSRTLDMSYEGNNSLEPKWHHMYYRISPLSFLYHYVFILFILIDFSFPAVT